MRKLTPSDLSGLRFGRYYVICFSEKKRSDTYYYCLYQCGKVRSVRGYGLFTGHSKSCGCYSIDRQTTHGMTKTPTYNTWKSMITRCYDENQTSYPNYGGRGITVCEEWKNIDNFIRDMGYRPSMNYSLDRKDVNGNYEPSNCKWSTPSEQSRNKRTMKNNKSGRSGVRYYEDIKKWRAEIGVNGKKITLGFFSEYSTAVEEREKAEKKYWGEPS